MLWLSIYTVWYPQADLILALVITAIFSTFIGAMYALNVVAMPRSGSDYVFVSRTLAPAIGLAFSLGLVVWLMLMNSWNVYLSYAFLSQSFWSLGAMLNSATISAAWASVSSSTTGELVIGVLLYIICTVIVLIGLSRYMKGFQRWMNIISFASFAVIIVAALAFTNQDFIVHFNNYMSPSSGTPDPYHDIINLATSLGWAPASGYDWGQTITVSVLWFLISVWPMSSAWIGGEIKRADSARAQFLAMSGGQWFTDLACAFFIALWYRAFDKNWLAAVGYLTMNHPDKIPGWLAGAAPYWQLSWVNFLVGNVPLAILVSVAWIIQALALIPCLAIAASRHLFAWSFDRIAPTKLSDVSDRLHSPVTAVLVIGVITLIGYVFTVYTTYLAFAVGAPLGVLWCLLVASIATIVFRWRRKEIYERSAASRLKLAGVPLHAIAGVLALGTVLTMIYYYMGPLNSVAIGGLAFSITEITAALFVIGILGYYIAKWVQQKRGVPIELVFKQIPPE
jgi:amino acid transporter